MLERAILASPRPLLRLASTSTNTPAPAGTASISAPAHEVAAGTSDARLDLAPSTAPSSSDGSSSSHSSSSSASRPAGAYARFKALTKQYGSYAIVMYVLLSTVDFTLSFIAVHAVGAERVTDAVAPAVSLYRRVRFGAGHAAELDAADRARRADERRDRDERKRRRKERERARKEGRMTDAMRDEEAREKEDKGKSWYEDPALWAEAALAYGIHKTALLPLRAGLTVAWTPRVVEALRSAGWIKAAKKVTPA
ncbi:DUF1279 superfamily [Cryptotrichosporon argae]